MPCFPGDVLANTIKTSAIGAFEINDLEPFNMYMSPSFGLSFQCETNRTRPPALSSHVRQSVYRSQVQGYIFPSAACYHILRLGSYKQTNGCLSQNESIIFASIPQRFTNQNHGQRVNIQPF